MSQNPDIPRPIPAFVTTREILDLAAELEADEAEIKRRILDAATAGDCATVKDIVAAWLVASPAEILARLRMRKDARPPLNPRKGPQ